MKRRAEYLVEKRDGRREWLRATKLARSIHMAMLGSGMDEGWRALEVASTVLAGLRSRLEARCSAPSQLTTVDIAEAVQQVLIATGFTLAASTYSAVSTERARRRRALDRLRAERDLLGSQLLETGVNEAGDPRSPRMD